MPVPPPSNAKRIFHGHFIDFWQWDQELFDGTSTVFECVTVQDSVTVIPFVDPETVLIARQEQPARPPFFDFPGGRVDAGETLEQAAHRELVEETGLTPGRFMEWRRHSEIWKVRYEKGLYLATDLRDEAPAHLDPGEKITLERISWKELVGLCLKQQLRQADIMLAILAMEYDPESKARLQKFLRG